MGNSSDTITGIQSVVLFQIVPIIPGHDMRFRSLFPSLPVLNAQADHLQAVLVHLTDFLQLRLRHDTRTTSPAPEVQQDVFPAKLSQAVNLSFQVVHIRIGSFLAYFHYSRRIQGQVHALPFKSLFLCGIQTVVQLLHVFLIRIVFTELHRHPHPIQFIHPDGIDRRLFHKCDSMLRNLIAQLIRQLLQTVYLCTSLFLVSSLCSRPHQLKLLHGQPLKLFPFLAGSLHQLLLELLFLDITLYFPRVNIRIFSLYEQTTSGIHPQAERHGWKTRLVMCHQIIAFQPVSGGSQLKTECAVPQRVGSRHTPYIPLSLHQTEHGSVGNVLQLSFHYKFLLCLCSQCT